MKFEAVTHTKDQRIAIMKRKTKVSVADVVDVAAFHGRDEAAKRLGLTVDDVDAALGYAVYVLKTFPTPSLDEPEHPRT